MQVSFLGSLLKNRARQRIRILQRLEERLRRVPGGWIPCGRRALFQKALLRRSRRSRDGPSEGGAGVDAAGELADELAEFHAGEAGGDFRGREAGGGGELIDLGISGGEGIPDGLF